MSQPDTPDPAAIVAEAVLCEIGRSFWRLYMPDARARILTATRGALASLPQGGVAIPDDLRQLSEAATPGEWTGGHRCDGALRAGLPGDRFSIGREIPASDAALIAAAVNFVRAQHEQPKGGDALAGDRRANRALSQNVASPGPATAGLGVIPDGWVLVPREVTGKMVDAANDALDDADHWENGLEEAWTAMLAAAPPPPVPAPEPSDHVADAGKMVAPADPSERERRLEAALQELLDYRGGAEHALADDHVVERARAALADGGQHGE